MHLSQKTLLISYRGAIQPLFLLVRGRCCVLNRAVSPSLIHPKFKDLLSSLEHVHTELLTPKPAPTIAAAHFPTAAHPEDAGLGAGRDQMQELNKTKSFPENRK